MLRTATAATAATAMVGVCMAGQAAAEMSVDPGQPTQHDPVDVGVVRLGPAMTSPGGGGASLTPRLGTAPYEMVAVTSQGASVRDVELRTRSGGAWTRWQKLEALGDHGPDAGSGEARRSADLSATELLWVGRSDGVQVRADRSLGRDARVLLVDPGTLPSDTRPEAVPSPAGRVRVPRDSTQAPDTTDAPQPAILSRSDWGADESWRSGQPVYDSTIKQAHIHHTAGSNDYSRADVPAIIRGDYWYHTQVLGWSDLGYNFVVDKFGRIWEGRAGGIDRPVHGAHTLGFNTDSVGVAAIGEYGSATPSPDLVRSLVRLTAWKLDAYGRKPAGHVRVRSAGSDLYPAGTWVRLPVIDGHRDTNQTECPGDNLYAKLPDIRRRAQARADAVYAQSGSPAPVG